MSTLIQVYQTYSEFKAEAYFVTRFDQLPSKLWLNIPCKGTKTKVEKVLALLAPKAQGLELVFQHWSTEDSRDTDLSNDYPYEFLFAGRDRHLLIWISLSSSHLEVHFYYDLSAPELETWVRQTNHQLRQAFGKERKPAFQVLCQNRHCFYTQEVQTDEFQIDVARHYNDDFQEVDQLIRQSLANTQGGLILLHGTPGTGKTTYIKSLINRFKDQEFIFVQNEFVKQLLHPDFISFMLRYRNAVLIIEDGEKVLTSRDQDNENSVVSTILQLTDGLFSDYLNIKIICTFNTHLDRIDKALLRKGRMIAYYEFKPLSNQKSKALMKDLGQEVTDQEMTLADIFNGHFNYNGKQK